MRVQLAVGLILVLMSIVHIVYGEKKQVDVLKGATSDSVLIGSFRVMSLQGGLLLFAVGTAYLLDFAGIVPLTGPAAYFPVAIVSLNILGVLLVALAKHRELLAATVPQFIIFAAIVALQVAILVRS